MEIETEITFRFTIEGKEFTYGLKIKDFKEYDLNNFKLKLLKALDKEINKITK